MLVLVVMVAAFTAAAGTAAAAEGDLSPRDGWDFAFKDFVIAAWNPPADTDAEYAYYKKAGFNIVMSVRYKLPDNALALAQKHGLKLLVDTYTPNDKPWGGTASKYTPHPTHHPATLPELKWLFERYGKHPALAGFLLGDDYGYLPTELVETTKFLREHAPHLFPWVCQNVMSGAGLAKAGNPIMDPQIYPTLYQRDLPVSEQCRLLCEQLQQLRALCAKHDLIPWPMVNVHGVHSDSMNRFQVYASLAYGAQGIWYFTYSFVMSGDMLSLQDGTGYATEDDVKAHLTPTWRIIADINRRVAAWGPQLLGRVPQGVYHTGPWPDPLKEDKTLGGEQRRHALSLAQGSERPAKGKLVERMSDELLVGIIAKPDDAPLAMVVDKRVDSMPDALAPREIEVQFADCVVSIEVLEGRNSAPIAGNRLSLSLPAGGGQLVRLNTTRK